jgi:hypothetical protein
VYIVVVGIVICGHYASVGTYFDVRTEMNTVDRVDVHVIAIARIAVDAFGDFFWTEYSRGKMYGPRRTAIDAKDALPDEISSQYLPVSRISEARTNIFGPRPAYNGTKDGIVEAIFEIKFAQNVWFESKNKRGTRGNSLLLRLWPKLSQVRYLDDSAPSTKQ